MRRFGSVGWRGAMLAVAAAGVFASGAWAQTAGRPEGVWLLEGKAAVDIFDCGGLMCGRIVWLQVPRNLLGQMDRDFRNPDPALRGRELCGQTILWGMRPDGPDRWKDGWFYNPDDGVTYRFSAQLKSADLMAARIYRLLPLFGQSKRLVRVAQAVTEGWCLALQPPSPIPGGGGSGPRR